MIDEFKNLIHTPKKSLSALFAHTQNTVLTTLEEILPSSFDVSELDRIFAELQQISNDSRHTSLQQIEFIQQQWQAMSHSQLINQIKNRQNIMRDQLQSNLKLISYFIRTIRDNCVSIQVYQLLEDQTQKAQATIRSHIQLEQQMHMHMQQLQKKQMHYQQLATKSIAKLEALAQQQPASYIEQTPQKQKISKLIRQRENLLTENSKMKAEIEELGNQLRKINAIQRSKGNQELCRRIVNLSFFKAEEEIGRNHKKNVRSSNLEYERYERNQIRYMG